MKRNVVSRIGGGNASRFEVYGLFIAAVVLIGGGVSGAIIATAGDSEVAAPQTTLETTTTESATTTTAVTTTAPPETTAPPTTRDPQVGSLPATTAPQPVQDFTAYCTMPDIIGTHTARESFVRDRTLHLAGPQTLMNERGCSQMQMRFNWSACIDIALPDTQFRVVSQAPVAGTLVHLVLGEVTFSVAMPLAVDPGRQRSDWPDC